MNIPWYKRIAKGPLQQKKRDIPKGVWLKCQDCGEVLYEGQLRRALWVCKKCDYHFRIPAKEYLAVILDEGSFRELHVKISPKDPLGFKDTKTYNDRLKAAQKKTGLPDAAIVGVGTIQGNSVALGALEFAFMGGSMGSVVGEKIARIMDYGRERRIPVVTVTATGGARMQEGILSLMQMAKTAGAVARLKQDAVPFISILTHPSTAGVLASYASLGDITIAEPKALLGFAGPRVIQRTIGQELPDGFQRSEFFLEHGMVDMVVARGDLRDVLADVLRFFMSSRPEDAAWVRRADHRQAVSSEGEASDT
jgi:acetyl-CoA carboxylase carboxyl transferase subunit beta